MIKIKLIHMIAYFYMLPAIIIGVLAMIYFDVSSSIWMQNIIIWILGSILAYVYLSSAKQNYISKFILRNPVVIIVLLLSPFFFNGIDDIHRWISLGTLNFYVASIFIPLLLIQLWSLTENNHLFYVMVLCVIVQIILLLQPDAGQVTAFASATSVLLWGKINNRLLKLLYISITITVVIISWLLLDDLAPVPYVEQILFLVGDMGIIWLILGILSLILLIFPFIFKVKKTNISLSLSVYFLMMILVTFIGNFPMPIMGYGTSPIIGYIIAITWLTKINR